MGLHDGFRCGQVSAVGHWNEAIFSRSPLPRVELVERLSDLFERHGLRQGHRYRMLTRGHAVAGKSLREVRDEVEPWQGVTFDLTWPDGDEVDFRMWRDASGDHHIVFGESPATLARRIASNQLEAFARFCAEVCVELEMRYAVYEPERLDHDEKLTGVDAERALSALLEHAHARAANGEAAAPAPAIVVLPRGELPAGAASAVTLEPAFTLRDLACWVAA